MLLKVRCRAPARTTPAHGCRDDHAPPELFRNTEDLGDWTGNLAAQRHRKNYGHFLDDAFVRPWYCILMKTYEAFLTVFGTMVPFASLKFCHTTYLQVIQLIIVFEVLSVRYLYFKFNKHQ